MKTNTPFFLVLVVLCGATTVAILEDSYRDAFMRLAETTIVGFWGYMQQPKD